MGKGGQGRTAAAAAAILHTACQVLAVSLNKKGMSAFCVLGGRVGGAGSFLSSLPSALMLKLLSSYAQATGSAWRPASPTVWAP